MESRAGALRECEEGASLRASPPRFIGDWGRFPHPNRRPQTFYSLLFQFPPFEGVEKASCACRLVDLAISGLPVLYTVLAPNRRDGAMPARRVARWKARGGRERHQTTGKTLPRGSAPSFAVHRPLPPRREPKSEGKAASRLVHRRARRRWTGPTGTRRVQNDGGESPPPFCTLFTPGSPNPTVVGRGALPKGEKGASLRASLPGFIGDWVRFPHPNRRPQTFFLSFHLSKAWRKRVARAVGWIWPFVACQYFTQYWRPTDGTGRWPRGELRDGKPNEVGNET